MFRIPLGCCARIRLLCRFYLIIFVLSIFPTGFCALFPFAGAKTERSVYYTEVSVLAQRGKEDTEKTAKKEGDEKKVKSDFQAGIMVKLSGRYRGAVETKKSNRGEWPMKMLF